MGGLLIYPVCPRLSRPSATARAWRAMPSAHAHCGASGFRIPMKKRRSRRAGTPACVAGSSAWNLKKYALASASIVAIEATASGSSTFSR